MNSQKDLHAILDQVATQIIADFQASAIVEHRGSKGTVREDIVRPFLADYMPGTVTVAGSGELLATTGQVSGQSDIMILDAGAPHLWRRESYRIAPIESCYATIEVKSNLTVEELRKAWSAAIKMKSLPRTAYLTDPSPIVYKRMAYGREVTVMPPQAHVFAFSSASLETLGQELAGPVNGSDDPSLGIDSICLMDRGIITWFSTSNGQMGMRLPDSKVAAVKATPGQALLFLVLVLNKHLATATLNPKFDIGAYATKSFGDLLGLWP